jgi:hypothetical protein
VFINFKLLVCEEEGERGKSIAFYYKIAFFLFIFSNVWNKDSRRFFDGILGLEEKGKLELSLP